MVVLIPLAMLGAAMTPGQATRLPSSVVPPGGQVGPTSERGDIAAEQITRSRVDQAIDQLPRAASKHPVAPQITPRTAGSVAPSQLAAEGGKSASLPQLAPPARSAGAPVSAVTRAQGRQTGLVRVGGSDRCDPQAQRADAANCQRVIEARAAEFDSPVAPTLTPEQRLLRDQDRGGVRSIATAAQRIGRTDVDADATDTQVLAAVSRGQSDEPAPKAPAATDQLPSSAVLIQMIEAAQNAVPRP